MFGFTVFALVTGVVVVLLYAAAAAICDFIEEFSK